MGDLQRDVGRHAGAGRSGFTMPTSPRGSVSVAVMHSPLPGLAYAGWCAFPCRPVPCLHGPLRCGRHPPRTRVQIKYLVTQGCIKPLCDLLQFQDPRIVTVALEGLENILKQGYSERNGDRNECAPPISNRGTEHHGKGNGKLLHQGLVIVSAAGCQHAYGASDLVGNGVSDRSEFCEYLQSSCAA